MLSIMTMATVLGTIAIGGEMLNIATKRIGNKGDTLATSEFITAKELDYLSGIDGLKISKTVQLNANKSMENVCVIGATGEGKTTSLFYPNLLTKDLKGSIIVSDPKKELYRDTSFYQRSIGRKPLLFCPLDPFNSIKYNPLEQAEDITEVTSLAQTILLNGSKALELETGVKGGGVEWVQMSLPLFIASLLYCKSKGKPLNTITTACRLIINRTAEELDLLFKSAGEEAQEQYNIFKMSVQSPATADSIRITLGSNITLFLDKKIEMVTSSTDFTAEQLREKPIALYISYSEVKSSYLSPLMAVFFSQFISKLMENYKPNSLGIYFMFDEFANIGIINGFSKIPAISRSRKISFLICLQSISQLEQLYGEYNTKSIMNNLKTKAILPSISDMQTLNYIEQLMDDTEITTVGTSQSEGKTSTSKSMTKRKLLNQGEIRRLDNDTILIIAHNKQPILDQQNIYYLNSEYTSKIEVCNY